jgi:fatty-acyl-CoA synthase
MPIILGDIIMIHQSKFLERLHDNFINKSNQIYSITLSDGEEQVLKWNDLEKDCQSIMQSLSGIKKSVVLIFLRHSSLLPGAFLGAMMAGHTPSFMPCTSIKQDAELYWSSHQKLLNHIQPSAIITSKDVSSEMIEAGLNVGESKLIIVENLTPPKCKLPIQICSEDDIALLQHSSGTTGLKKGVALSFESILKHAKSYSSAIEIGTEDRIVSWLPLYHDMGLMACMIMPSYTATPVIHLNPFEWVGQPYLLFDAIERYSGTLTWMPNFAFEHMALYAPRMPKEYTLDSMRAFISCSEVCRPESFSRFIEAFQSLGINSTHLQTCYAMAETVFATAQTKLGNTPQHILVDQLDLNRGSKVEIHEDESKLETPRILIETGSIIDGLEVEIVDESHNRLPEMTIGEISISGSFIFNGYHKKPELTDKKFNGNNYLTRDLGFMDKSGKLYVLGRIDDLIIVQGRNIYAHQVEALVSEIKGVKAGRVSAFGVFNKRVGSESLILVCEVKDTLNNEDISATKLKISKLLQSTIEVIPKKIVFVKPGWLMKTSSGKVGRKENKAKYLRETIEGK